MLSKADNVKVEIYNIKGERIDTVLDKYLDAGNHSVIWNPTNIPSGIYYYRKITSDTDETKKIILLK